MRERSGYLNWMSNPRSISRSELVVAETSKQSGWRTRAHKHERTTMRCSTTVPVTLKCSQALAKMISHGPVTATTPIPTDSSCEQRRYRGFAHDRRACGSSCQNRRGGTIAFSVDVQPTELALICAAPPAGPRCLGHGPPSGRSGRSTMCGLRKACGGPARATETGMESSARSSAPGMTKSAVG